jgi:hypothetical protein
MDAHEQIATYLDEQGRLKQYPTRHKRAQQLAALAYLADKFEIGRVYTEKEVTELLKQWHTFEDWALLRREMFELGLLNREQNGSTYWRTPNTKLY